MLSVAACMRRLAGLASIRIHWHPFDSNRIESNRMDSNPGESKPTFDSLACTHEESNEPRCEIETSTGFVDWQSVFSLSDAFRLAFERGQQSNLAAYEFQRKQARNCSKAWQQESMAQACTRRLRSRENDNCYTIARTPKDETG